MIKGRHLGLEDCEAGEGNLRGIRGAIRGELRSHLGMKHLGNNSD